MTDKSRLKYLIRKQVESGDNTDDDSNVLSEECVEAMSESFGKGIAQSRMLVTKRISAKELHELSK